LETANGKECHRKPLRGKTDESSETEDAPNAAVALAVAVADGGRLSGGEAEAELPKSDEAANLSDRPKRSEAANEVDETNEGDAFPPADRNSRVFSSATVSAAFADLDNSSERCTRTLRPKLRESAGNSAVDKQSVPLKPSDGFAAADPPTSDV
jgi:hypothetical protein